MWLLYDLQWLLICQQGRMEGEQSIQAEGGGQKVAEDTRRTLKKVSSSQPCPLPQICTITQFPTLQVGWKLGRNSLLALSANLTQTLPSRPPTNTQKGSRFQWGPTDATSMAEQGSWVCHIPKQWKWESQEFWQPETLISSLREA